MLNQVTFAPDSSVKKMALQVEYPVMESFATIQGEGRHTGTFSYFIRLGGCDVGCHWCDVKESWPEAGHPIISTKYLLSQCLDSSANIVVVTGGEPTMHNLDDLTHQLKSSHFKTHIETAGVHELTGQWDWITLSPKKFKEPKEQILSLASELKVIVYNKSDFDFAEKYASKVSENCLLYLQPEWDNRSKAMPLIVEYVKQNPKWKISLQTHKYLDIP